MSIQRQKEKKKKDREKNVKAKLLVERDTLRKERKLVQYEQMKEQAAHDLVHGRSRPIISDPAVLAANDAAKAREISDRLHKNLEILEALEQEYEAEQKARSEMNENLESEGHKTMREKMDALHQKALEMTGKAELLAEAEENYAATVIENIAVQQKE